jgi:hypothetical protein
MQNYSIYNQILKEVCDYYQAKRYDVLMKRDTLKNASYNKARIVFIYLIKQITGDTFKAINIFFDMPQTGSYAGTKHNMAAHNYMTDDKYKREVDELLIRCEQKINLAVS